MVERSDKEMLAYLLAEIYSMQTRIANIECRVEEFASRPEEILEEIHKLWEGDPETCPSNGKACHCSKPVKIEV